MKKANREQNLYVRIAAPYLSALRTVQLAEGYGKLDDILEGYDDAVNRIKFMRAANETETQRLAEERRLDIERKKAQRKMKAKK